VVKTRTLIAILVAGLWATGTASAAPKSSVPFGQALRDAEMIASFNPAWSVQRTTGESMGDFFGDNSLIIVQKTTLEEIKPGMMVVYRSTDGELISHQVVAHDGTAITTQGAANWSVDPEPVTAEMIVGVIFAVFHTSGAPEGDILASDGTPLPTAVCRTF